ncbi:MAG: PAS domain S-box protein [Bacteroidota bacterium]
MGDSTNQNKADDININSKLPGVLKFYKESSFSLQLKARIFFKICIAAIFALIILSISSSYVRLTGPQNALDFKILIPIIILLLIFVGCLALLLKGKFNIAAHLFLVSTNLCVWFIMFFARNEHVVIKLDTVVLIIAIINSIPLLINKYKSTIIFYIITNLIILFLFISYFKNDYGLSNAIVIDYFADTAIALFFSGIVIYQIARINHKTLKKVETDYQKRAKAENELKKSETIRKKIFESSSIPMVIMDAEYFEFVDLNDAAVEIYGYDTRDDVVGKTQVDVSADYQHGGELSGNKLKKIIEKANQEGTLTFEWLHQRPNGECWDAEVHLLSFEFENKLYIQYSLVDITERKRAKDALAKSERRFRSIFENAQVGIYQSTTDGEILQANPALLEILGYDDIESLFKRNLTKDKYFVDKSRKEFMKEIQKKGFVKDFKTEWLKNNGEKIIIRENARIVKDSDGNIKYFEGFVVDITERERVMKALAESEEKYREMTELLPVAIWEINLNGICTYTNKVGFQIHGYTPDDLVKGINVLDLIIPEQRDYAANTLKKRLNGFVSHGDEYIALRKDGTTFPAKIYTSVIYHNKKPVGFIGVTIDITETKKAAQEVKESEEQLKMALLGAKLGMWDWSIKNNIIKVNDLFVEMLGYTLNDFVGGVLTFEDWKKMLHQDDFDNAMKLFNEHVEKKTELYEAVFRMRHKNGDWKWILARGKVAEWIKGEPMRALGTHLDITTRKKAEQELEKYRKHLEFLVQDRTEELATANEELTSTNEELLNQRQELETVLLNLQNTQKQLVHSEKMASLGVLASGIAHEINNPLNFIKGGVYGIESYVKENLKEYLDELDPFLDGVNEGIYRAAEIVKSLNHYNRRDDSVMVSCDIHSIIDNCLVMLKNQIKDRIKIEKKFTTKEYVLACNEGKLHQAILNVLTNAAHAIEEKGTIRIKTFVIAKEFKLEITDTGTGISDEHVDKILDPFFTTKAPGKGTGLGLSITYNILQEHNGTIEFKSKLHKGTTVIITLPLKTQTDGK